MTRQAAEELGRRLLGRIAELQLRPGERLGSERALAELFGVSRSLLRESIDLLVDEQRVRRSMGRGGGVVVDDGRIGRHLNTIVGVPAMLRGQGFVHRTEVRLQQLAVAEAAEARALGLEGGSVVVRIERLRFADDVPWSLDRSVLPAARFPGLDAQELSGSLYDVLETRYGVAPAEAEETIEVAAATGAQAAALGIDVGGPVLEIWRITRDGAGEPIEFAHDAFSAARTRVHLRKHRIDWKHRPPSATVD